MSIALENVSKRYAGQTIVDRVSLEVQTGELFVLLGASGSGKSTILRLISGLLPPDEGAVLLGGRDVTALPPQKRDVGFVFQNYSIFRHMTVAENIEFGLRIRRVPAAERQSRREELLDLVGLAGLGSRYDSQLSGGQLQRVALARALAYKPTVLLLDEPFGALDVKIRAQLRQNLKQVQKSLGVTTILVTHDQEEGFELGQRIGVIDRGRLLEVGAPEDLYAHPRSLFAATFLGAGTILVGRCRSERVELGPLTLPIPPDVPHDEGDRVRVLFRPEHVTLSGAEPPPSAAVLGRAESFEETFSGSTRRVHLRLPPVSG
ncbi:MAG TPA: ABC transporter ATP-binding protein, partial [Thermoanaerobaculia bacterium]|nr:ABC transporter ATP-binding protein [Thermoanaerobaculia bacterium]